MKKVILIIIILVCVGVIVFVFNKPNKPTKEEMTIIYRYSSDILFNGDKIDLNNKKITNYRKYEDIERSENLIVSTNETKDMTGIYSTNLDDVLKISKDLYGNPIETIDNYQYIKHEIDSNGIIKKSSLCLVETWETLCEEYKNGENLDFNSQQERIYKFYKWNDNHSPYKNVICKTSKVTTENGYRDSLDCTSNNGIYIAISYGYLATNSFDSACYITSDYSLCK